MVRTYQDRIKDDAGQLEGQIARELRHSLANVTARN